MPLFYQGFLAGLLVITPRSMGFLAPGEVALQHCLNRILAQAVVMGVSLSKSN